MQKTKPYTRLTTLIFTLIVISALSGCASIVSRNSYPVAIDSAPSGVSFFVTDSEGARVHSGVTPSSVTLRTKGGYFKSEAYTIHLERSGLPTREYAIRSGMDGWYWGNLLLGGLLGMLIVDPLTGAMFKLPPQVLVPLDGSLPSAGQPEVQSKAKTTTGQSELRIASMSTLTAEERARLVALD